MFKNQVKTNFADPDLIKATKRKALGIYLEARQHSLGKNVPVIKETPLQEFFTTPSHTLALVAYTGIKTHKAHIRCGLKFAALRRDEIMDPDFSYRVYSVDAMVGALLGDDKTFLQTILPILVIDCATFPRSWKVHGHILAALQERSGRGLKTLLCLDRSKAPSQVGKRPVGGLSATIDAAINSMTYAPDNASNTPAGFDVELHNLLKNKAITHHFILSCEGMERQILRYNGYVPANPCVVPKDVMA